MNGTVVSLIDCLGYMGSVFVALSLFMSSIVRLRILNFLGNVCFIAYGLTKNVPPVVITNGLVCCINIYHLYQLFNNKEYLSVLHIEKDFAYLTHFLHIHRAQVVKFFPDFDPHALAKLYGFYILKGDTTVGVFLGYPNDQGDFIITLDYVAPRYRDLKVAKWLFLSQEKFFRDLGCKHFLCETKIKKHMKYLTQIGFTASKDNKEIFKRDIW